MVKNSKGGSGNKKLGRKFMSNGNTNNKQTRFSKDVLEIYAVCTKIYGSGYILVKCQDSIERLCLIRYKFIGRGAQRDNSVVCGTCILVGLRHFEVRAANKLQRCDLLEVYSSTDVKNLIQHEKNIQWSIFNIEGIKMNDNNDFEFTDAKNDDIEFTDDKTIQYTELQLVDDTGDTDDIGDIDIDDI